MTQADKYGTGPNLENDPDRKKDLREGNVHSESQSRSVHQLGCSVSTPFVRSLFYFLLVVVVTISGCTPILETKYADSRGASINGIVGFVNLLRQSGRKVRVWPGVSPRMANEYQTVVVFQSTFHEPTETLRRELQDLMFRGTIETLIIIVRDSDAAIDYWRQISDRAEGTAKEIAEQKNAFDTSMSSFTGDASAEFDSKEGHWYGLKLVDRTSDELTRSVECLSEREPFAVDARWPLNRRLVPVDSAKVLWRSGDDPLLTREETTYGNILILASAAPLLNGGLVDSGNRRLTAELVRSIPETDHVAVATSSLWIDDSNVESPGILQFLKVYPNGWVFGQGIAALFLFCWWKFPIFGRPRQTTSVETARFGRHVDALGKLLRRTRNVSFAQERIRDWHGIQKNRTDSDSEQIT